MGNNQLQKNETKAGLTLERWHPQLFKTLSVQRISDIFQSSSLSVVAVKREKGEVVAQAMVTVILTDFLENFDVVRPMNAEKTARCVTEIMDRYYFWKPEDFKYCFEKVLFGGYGKEGRVLDRVDIATVLGWCEMHNKERMEEAMHISEKQHEESKSKKPLVVNEKILEAFKSAIPEKDLNIPILPPMKPVSRMSPFELELHKHFKRFDELHKNFPANNPGDIEPVILHEGKKVNAPEYVRIMIEKTT